MTKETGAKWRWPASAAQVKVLVLQAMAIGVALLVAPRLLASAVELPKRLLVEGLLIAGWVALLAERTAEGRMPFRRGALDAPLLAILAGSVVSSLLSTNRWLSLEYTGLMLAYAGIAWLIVSGLNASQYSRLVSALLLAGGIEGVYGILQYAGIDFLPWESSWGSRCFGTIGNPVFFAEFLAPLFVLGLSLWIAERDEERKDLLALLSVVLFLALVFAQTRSAWLGSFVGAGVAGLCLWRIVPGGRDLLIRNRSWLMAFSGFALAVVLTISSPRIFGEHALPIRDRIADAFNFKGWTVQHRAVLWRAGILMLRDSPLVGVGPEQFRSHFPLKQANFREAYAKRGFTFPPKEQKAHNDYVQTAAETGIFGLGLWFWLLAVIARVGLLAVRRSLNVESGALAAGLLGGCVVLVVDSGFNFPFRIIPAATVFWMMAGGLALLGSRDRGISHGPIARDAGAPIMTVVAAVAGVSVFLWLAIPRVIADRATAAGNRYFGSNMFEMAQEQYRRSLSCRPWDTVTIYQMGLALERSARFDWTGRKWDAAMRQFERASRLGLNDELLYGQMALLYEKKGLYSRSIASARLSLRIYPENPDHSANLAYWYSVREENMHEALALVRRAVASSPEHPLYLWTHGLVLEKLGRPREAYAKLGEALSRLSRIKDGANHISDLKIDIARLKEKGRV